MIKTIKLTALALLFILKANAQIQIEDTKKLDKVKGGQTYVMVKTTTFPGADKFLQAMQKDWTLSQGIHYLPQDNSTITIQPNDSFLSLESLTVTTPNAGTLLSYYLSFWTCKGKFFKKDRALKQSDHELIAQVMLSQNGSASNAKKFFEDYDFDGGDKLLNLSPGMVHNYLQQITTLLTAGKKRKFQDEVENKEELAHLKNEILYVPDFNVLDLSEKTVNEEETNEIFAKYTYAYKILSKENLDKLILTSDKPIYYFLFITYNANKLICVINSKTGETVYLEATSLSLRLKSVNLKSLFKAVSKS